MGYLEAMELAQIRNELRERLMAERFDDVDELLQQLQIAAADDVPLRREHERWRLRFDLLSVTGLAA